MDISLITKAIIALGVVAILGLLGYHLEQVGEDRMELVYTKRIAAMNAQADKDAAERAKVVHAAEAQHAAEVGNVMSSYVDTLAENERLKNEKKSAVDAAFNRGLYFNSPATAKAGAVRAPDAAPAGGNGAGVERTRLPDDVAGFLRRESERADDTVSNKDAKIALLQGIVKAQYEACK